MTIGDETIGFQRHTAAALEGKVFVCDAQRVRVSAWEAEERAAEHIGESVVACRPDRGSLRGHEFYDFDCLKGDDSEPIRVRVNLRSGDVSVVEP